MVYKFKEGARIKLPAQTVGERLAKIAKESGGDLYAERVVEDAESKASPLHEHFEWDDKEAAHQYRVGQAQYLIRNVEVVITDEGYSGPVRAFVRTETMESGQYITIQALMNDDGKRTEYLDKLRREAIYCKNRLSKFEEFADVCKAIDAVVESAA